MPPSNKRRPRINTAPYVDLQQNKRRPQIDAALNIIHKQFMDRPPEAYTCACGTRPFFRIRFRPLNRRDAVSWVEMDCRQKEWSKEVSNEQYLSYMYVALEVVFCHISTFYVARSLPRLDPHTGVQLISAGCYCRSKCCTRRIGYWLLAIAKTSLDPTEY